MKKITLGFIILTLLQSHSLSAHPGHEHGTIDAGLVHLLWLVPVIVAAAIVVFKEITTSKGE